MSSPDRQYRAMHRARPTLRQAAVVLWAALSVLAGLTACTSGPTNPGSPGYTGIARHDGRPNIVFVLTDDLSTNLLPYLPHVQALMQTGISFDNYFVVDSLCCPSRTSIFTGLYPHDDGVYKNSGPDGGFDAFQRYGNPAKSFALPLQAAGYHTGYMGKYLNGYLPSYAPQPGWDEWDTAGDAYSEFNYELNENGAIKPYGHDAKDYLTDVLAGKASQFITESARAGAPFALEVATFAPHFPSTPAPRDLHTFPKLRAPRGPAFDKPSTGAAPWLARLKPLSHEDIGFLDLRFRRRVESMQAVDRMVGRLQRSLAAVHQLDNTYFIFSSDNGFHIGDYRMLAGKQTAFDTDTRVPLVVAGPGVPAGATVKAMASSIDLAPTFFDIAGAKALQEPDGVSLLDLLHGGPAPADWQHAVLIEHHGPVTSPGDPDAQPPAAGDPPSYEAMRTPTALYVEYDTGDRQYFDLTHDPYELHNVAATLSATRLAKLHSLLEALANCHGAAACQHAASPAQV
jgi:N-acetylglucosamine-6-sulfatase